MDLTPLTSATLPIRIHTYAATAAFVLGLVQLAGAKGTARHRALGYAWAGLMLAVAVSAFFIHELRLWGPWSPIHLLAVLTLATLPLGIHRARRHEVDAHRKTMLGLFLGALLIAGLFTLAPGRILHQVLFGG